MKYHETENVGHAKYVVSFHVPGKTHRDGSEFYDIRIFSNKKLKDKFIRSLREQGQEVTE